MLLVTLYHHTLILFDVNFYGEVVVARWRGGEVVAVVVVLWLCCGWLCCGCGCGEVVVMMFPCDATGDVTGRFGSACGTFTKICTYN